MRAGVLEGSSLTCAHCNGSGMVRSVESRALHVLRQIDEAASRNEGGEVTVQVPEDVAIYLLNNKRQQLGDIEASRALTINVEIDRELTSMEMTLIAPNQGKNGATTRMEGDPTAALEDDNGNGRKRRRGKRGGRQNGDAENDSRHPDRSDDGHDEAGLIEADAENDADARDAASANGYDDEDGDKPRRRRRRGRRGGRRRRRDNDGMEAEAADKAEAAEAIDADETIDTGAPIQIESEAEAEAAAEIDVTAALDEIVTPEPEETSEEAPKKPKTRRKRTVKADKDSDKDSDDKPKKPTRRIRTKKAAADETPAPIAEDGGAEESAVTGEIQPVAAADSSEDDATDTTDTTETPPPDDTKPARRGWWRRGEA